MMLTCVFLFDILDIKGRKKRQTEVASCLD
jgi:hypothetical protein